MNIERKNDDHKEVLSIQYNGFGWYETYGPSMTDWASFYKIKDLLLINTKDKVRSFEKLLPPEIKSLHILLNQILKEIEREKTKEIQVQDLEEYLNFIPSIENQIKKLKEFKR